METRGQRKKRLRREREATERAIAEAIAARPKPTRLAGNVAAHMRALGLSRASLAKRAGLHTQTVELILRGTTQKPSSLTVEKLALAMGVTPNDLHGIGEEDVLSLEERWLVTEYRRLNKNQRMQLLEYLRDAADELEGRVRRRGLRKPKGIK